MGNKMCTQDSNYEGTKKTRFHTWCIQPVVSLKAERGNDPCGRKKTPSFFVPAKIGQWRELSVPNRDLSSSTSQPQGGQQERKGEICILRTIASCKGNKILSWIRTCEFFNLTQVKNKAVVFGWCLTFNVQWRHVAVVATMSHDANHFAVVQATIPIKAGKWTMSSPLHHYLSSHLLHLFYQWNNKELEFLRIPP